MLPDLQKNQISRWVATQELHTFCDASLEGYGCATYERTERSDGSAHVALLYARALIVPNDMLKQALKDQESLNGSIPRLELNAARKGAESGEFVSFESPITYEGEYFWCDSKCVLQWIADDKTRFKTFIHNRKATILDLTKRENWGKVPTHLNPADVCSHGAYPGDPGWDLFLKCADFLSRPKSEWSELLGETVSEPVPEVIIDAFTVESYEKRVKED
jgi:hypothetical protein